MHWSTSPYIELYEIIQADEQSALPAMQQAFDILLEDFKALLDTPKKNEASRQKLEKGM